MTPQLRVLSLGAGVQSTTLALMAKHGDVEMPDCAITADTKNESQKTYAHLAWLETQLPFPIHYVGRGDLGDDCLRNARGEMADGKKKPSIPAYTMGSEGRAAPLTRTCTQDYKIDQIVKKERELIGIGFGQRVPRGTHIEVWIGISTDEIQRMKPSRLPWVKHRWPLIEHGMSREGCKRWLADRQYKLPPKSACVFCPYHSDTNWRNMRDHDPESWAQAIAFDAAIRGGFAGNHGEIFLHRSLRPLSEVDLSTWAERGQPDLFNNECEGMCGV